MMVKTADFLSSEEVVARKVTLQKKEYEVVPWGDSDEHAIKRVLVLKKKVK